MEEFSLHSSGSGLEQAAGSYGHGNEPSRFIECCEKLE